MTYYSQNVYLKGLHRILNGKFCQMLLRVHNSVDRVSFFTLTAKPEKTKVHVYYVSTDPKHVQIKNYGFIYTFWYFW